MYLQKCHKYLSFPLFADLGRHHVHEKIQRRYKSNKHTMIANVDNILLNVVKVKHLFSQADAISPIINALETSLANYQSPMLSSVHIAYKKTMFHQIINCGMPASEKRHFELFCIYIYSPHSFPN